MIKKLKNHPLFLNFWDKPMHEGLPCISMAKVSSPANLVFPVPSYGRGVDCDLEIARLKAAMEAIERYAAYLPPEEKIYWGKSKDFEPYVSSFISLKTSSLPEKWWIEVREYFTNNISYIPLEYAQLSSICRINNPIIEADSTGYAAHTEIDECFMSGISEVVERFSLSILWNEGSHIVWDDASLPNSAKNILFPLKDIGYDFIIIPKIYVKEILTCVVLIIKKDNRNDHPLFAWGAAADFIVEKALLKAILEAYAQIVNAYEILNLRKDISIEESFKYYNKKKNLQMLMNILIKQPTVKLNYPNISNIEGLERSINDFKILLRNRTPSELIDYGVHIQQIIIPEMYAEYKPREIMNPFRV